MLKFAAFLFLFTAMTTSIALAGHCGYCLQDDFLPRCSCDYGEFKQNIKYPGVSEIYHCCRTPGRDESYVPTYSEMFPNQ